MNDESGGSGFRSGRRQFMRGAGALGLAGLAGGRAFAAPRVIGVPPQASPPLIELPFENGTRPLIQYPQKRPLIELTSRPPQLETPFSVFNEGVLTPNDAFFVRYHLAKIPLTPTQVAQKLGVKLEADEDPGPVAFDQAKTQRALETMGGNRLTAFEADYRKNTGKTAGGADDHRRHHRVLARAAPQRNPPEAARHDLGHHRR